MSYLSCSTCLAVYRSDFLRCPTDGQALVEVSRDPVIGETIADQYVIEACIGEGAMGRVYRAHHARLEHRRYAVKILLGDMSATAAMRIRFAQEAESASKLSHPNVVPVLDFGKTPGGLLYLVMELVEGASLVELIDREAPMPAERVVRLARQLCAGLGHAHDAGLVHRDFKPDNVLVVRDGGVELPRIVDFGLAIAADPEAGPRLTSVGLAVGTPVYAAPEQVAAGAIDGRADLFALGVTMFELLAGTVPFDGNIAEVLHHNANTPRPSIASRASGVVVPPRLEAIVRRLMEPEPSARFATARDVIAALDDPALFAALPEPVAPAPRRRRLVGVGALVALGATAAIAAAAVTATWSRHRDRVAAIDAGAPAIARAPTPDAAPPAIARAATPDAAPALPPPDAGVAAVAIAPTAHTHAPPPHAHPHELAAAVAPDAGVVRAPAPAPVPVDAAPAIAVVPAPKPAPAPAPTPKPLPTPAPHHDPVPSDVHTAISGLEVHGSLPDAEIEHALGRVESSLGTCYLDAARAEKRGPRVSIAVDFVIDDTRRARDVHVDQGALAGVADCVRDRLAAVRTTLAPDVGTVHVSLHLAFTPVTP